MKVNVLKRAIALPLVFLCSLLSSCLSGDISPLSKNISEVAIGTNVREVVAKFGVPQKTQTHPALGAGFFVMNYCKYGYLKDDFLNVFVFNYEVIAVDSVGNTSNSTGQFNCNGYISDIDWVHPIAGITSDIYYINDLLVERIRLNHQKCSAGEITVFAITGAISNDSTVAMERLIDEVDHCRDTAGMQQEPIRLFMTSDGGYLEEGYALGRLLRENSVATIVPHEKLCASSCAVAFLGGKYRTLQGQGRILFHAPYHNQLNLAGNVQVSCKIGDVQVDRLRGYYFEMLGEEDGAIIFDRTMSFCDANGGWVISGESAADLFGISTDGFQ